MSVRGGVGGVSSIRKSGWNAVKCIGTSVTEVLDDPGGHRVELVVGVVVAGDDQVRDLHPDVGLVDQVLEGVEDVAQVRAAEPHVELFGERLEVDVRRVDVREELDPGLAGRCTRR